MSTPLTPEHEAQIREHVATMKNFSRGNLFARDLLAEVDRLNDELTGARLSLWEDGQEDLRLRLALTSAQRGRRVLRARLAELELQVRTLAVTAMGALPMPTRGELAEQRHLVDPLDHTLGHLADEPRPARDLRPGAAAALRMLAEPRDGGQA